MNTCSYGSFTKVVTFMRAFCNLIVLKSRENAVGKVRIQFWKRKNSFLEMLLSKQHFQQNESNIFKNEFFLFQKWKAKKYLSYFHCQYAQKPHMHINFTRHFFKIILMSILNTILKSDHTNIALLHDKISNKCQKITSIGTLMCFTDTFCLINTNRF